MEDGLRLGDRLPGDPAQPLERVVEGPLLGADLALGREVLELASPARLGVPAARPYPLRTGLEDAERAPTLEARTALGDLHLHEIAGSRQGDEGPLSRGKGAHAFAAVGDGVDS